MAAPATHTTALVLKKTKLGESDLILTLLAQDGALFQAVAKGARKPNSSLASRLELFSEADLLVAQGKSLGIVSDAKSVSSHATLRDDVVRSAAASCMAELMGKLAQEELPHQKYYPLTSAFLAQAEAAPEDRLPLLLAAALLKALAFSGFLPVTDQCTMCGADAATGDGEEVAYSYADGGPVCDACRGMTPTVLLPRALLRWVGVLLHSGFTEVLQQEAGHNESTALLQFCGAFIEAHVGARLKSLEFFLTCALPLVFPCVSE